MVAQPRRSKALAAAQERHDEARAHRRLVLRLTEAELLDVERLRLPEDGTPQATIRRILAEAAAHVRRAPGKARATSRRKPA